MEHGGATSSNPFPRIRPESVLVAIAAVVFVVLLFVGAGPPKRPGVNAAKPAAASSQAQAPAAPSKPTGVSPGQLRVQAGSLAHPVYWLGKQPGRKLELTVTSNDRIFLRYLPKGQPIGSPSLSYPFVATYGVRNAFGVVREASAKPGAVVHRLPKGGLAVQNKRTELVKAIPGRLPAAPVFLAYPGSDRIVEVYDPSAKRALALVTSGRARPVL